jgi:hypothetical protein
VPDTALPDRAGWFPDPYKAGQVRWFDGSTWTTHAVSPDEAHPDDIVERDFDPRTPEEMRTGEWKDQFPWWDVPVAQGSEPSFDGRGGPGGFDLAMEGRFDTRLGNRIKGGPYGAVIWLFVLAVFFGLVAWVAQADRVTFLVLTTATFVISCAIAIRTARQRAHWKQVGQGSG